MTIFSTTRMLLVSGGLMMVMGAAHPSPLFGQANPAVKGWQDPAWIFAITGLVTVVLGFLAPIVKSIMDMTVLRRQNAELSSKIDRLAVENRKLTALSTNASIANGVKLDKIQEHNEQNGSTSKEEITLTIVTPPTTPNS